METVNLGRSGLKVSRLSRSSTGPTAPEMDARERRLRSTFGPAFSVPERQRPSRGPRRHLLARIIVAITVAAVVIAGAGTFWAITPSEHVASGCFWWTAKTVGEILPGDGGGLRGYVVRGGGLAETLDDHAYRLSFLMTEPDTVSSRPPCPFRPGDPVVVRQHAIFDDGRTILIVEDCR
jgi:hypothetical protein